MHGTVEQRSILPSEELGTGIPMVSVIATTYNVGPYVEQCLESIAAQSERDIELIVVDDASKDQTLDVIEQELRCIGRGRCIQLSKNTPGGVGIPANIGLSMARGRYIAFADGDDWYEPKMLETLVRAAEESEADVVVANYKNFDEAAQRPLDPADAARWPNLMQLYAEQVFLR